MSYTYPNKRYPISADVDSLATALAQRQSDTGTTGGGILASGGSTAVPQLGVDATGLGLSYLKAMADAILAASATQVFSEVAGGGNAPYTGATFADADFASLSFTAPATKTYLITVDIATYVTVAVPAAIEFKLNVDNVDWPVTLKVYQAYSIINTIENTTWRAVVPFTQGATSTIKVRWKSNGTVGVGADTTTSRRCFTIQG